jgi:regulator of sirC expression with transglutaminase-like and TPR domain
MGGMTESIAYIGLLDDEEIQIEIAALELSALDHEGVDLAPYLALLSSIEERLASIGGDARTGVEQARALAQVIGAEYGFVGDKASYDAPINADLIRVVDRRRGLPVSLSILYVGLARRLGWQADALNTPGHVVVSLQGSDEPTVIDPFSRGRQLTPDALLALIAQAAGPSILPDELHLTAMTNRMALTRLLLNQASRAEGEGDPARAATLYERMTIVAPGEPRGWWELARLQIAAHDLSSARGSLAAMLEISTDAEQRERILATLDAIG